MTLEEILKRKKECGLTNAELSKISGVSIGTLNKILSGETRNPRYESVRAIEKVLIERNGINGGQGSLPVVGEAGFNYGNGNIAGRNSENQVRKSCTIDDYYVLSKDRRMELIDGRIYDLAAPSPLHQAVAGEIYFQISSFIRKNKGKCSVFLAPVDVKFPSDDSTILQPDLFIVCDRKKIDDKFINGAPDFVLEIVSASSADRDYVKKANKYLNEKVREYWIIDPAKKRLLVYNFEKSATPYICGMDGIVGINIYEGRAKIDLDAVAAIINEYGGEADE